MVSDREMEEDPRDKEVICGLKNAAQKCRQILRNMKKYFRWFRFDVKWKRIDLVGRKGIQYQLQEKGQKSWNRKYLLT